MSKSEPDATAGRIGTSDADWRREVTASGGTRFESGTETTGTRYRISGAALRFRPEDG
jgi:hypothetical protein